MFLCPHLQKLGVEFNIKHKSQEKCDHHSKHTKFIKNLMAKSPNPSIKSGRPKASFWLPRWRSAPLFQTLDGKVTDRGISYDQLL